MSENLPPPKNEGPLKKWMILPAGLAILGIGIATEETIRRHRKRVSPPDNESDPTWQDWPDEDYE